MGSSDRFDNLFFGLYSSRRILHPSSGAPLQSAENLSQLYLWADNRPDLSHCHTTTTLCETSLPEFLSCSTNVILLSEVHVRDAQHLRWRVVDQICHILRHKLLSNTNWISFKGGGLEWKKDQRHNRTVGLSFAKGALDRSHGLVIRTQFTILCCEIRASKRWVGLEIAEVQLDDGLTIYTWPKCSHHILEIRQIRQNKRTSGFARCQRVCTTAFGELVPRITRSRFQSVHMLKLIQPILANAEICRKHVFFAALRYLRRRIMFEHCLII